MWCLSHLYQVSEVISYEQPHFPLALPVFGNANRQSIVSLCWWHSLRKTGSIESWKQSLMGLTNEREETSLLTLPHQEGLLISRYEVIQTPCHQCPPWHGHVPTAPCSLSHFVQQAPELLDHWWADVWGVWMSSREANGFVQRVNCQRKESDSVLGRDFWTQLSSFPACALCWDS